MIKNFVSNIEIVDKILPNISTKIGEFRELHERNQIEAFGLAIRIYILLCCKMIGYLEEFYKDLLLKEKTISNEEVDRTISYLTASLNDLIASGNLLVVSYRFGACYPSNFYLVLKGNYATVALLFTNAIDVLNKYKDDREKLRKYLGNLLYSFSSLKEVLIGAVHLFECVDFDLYNRRN